jgi:hypothetical protein
MRRLRPLAALAVAALIGAGCGSNASSENGGAGTGTGSSGGNKNATNREKAMKFSECMRDHGVREFPDPDASGGLTIDGVLNGSSLDPNTPAWSEAIRACKDLQPPGFTGDHDVSAEEQDARLEFAQCIRDHGVEDFPDPAIGEPLVNTYKIPSSNRPGGMTILNAAMRKCGDLAAQAIGR